MFGQEATAIVTNEAAGVERGAQEAAPARSLPMPGVRGALARGEDHDYEPRPGAFLASPHVAQEIAWLQAEVTWSMADGQPPLAVEGGDVDLDGVPVVRFVARRGSLTIPAGGARLRCHALLFALGVDAADDPASSTSGTRPGQQATTAAEVGVELDALEAGEWQPAAAFTMPGAGTYLGLVALEKRPRTIEAVRLTLERRREVRLYDLALLTFG